MVLEAVRSFGGSKATLNLDGKFGFSSPVCCGITGLRNVSLVSKSRRCLTTE